MDRTGTLTVRCASMRFVCTSKTKLTADDGCIIHVPFVITDSTLLASYKNLNAAKLFTSVYPNIGNTIIAQHTGVFFMIAVVVSPFSLWAIVEMSLTSWATHVVKPDWSTSFAMWSASKHTCSLYETNLFTNYVRVSHVFIPVVIADGPPFTIVENFHSASKFGVWRGTIHTHAAIRNCYE